MTFSLVVKNKDDGEYYEIFSCEDFDDAFLTAEIQRCRSNRNQYHVEQVKKPVRHGYLSRLLELFK